MVPEEATGGARTPTEDGSLGDEALILNDHDDRFEAARSKYSHKRT